MRTLRLTNQLQEHNLLPLLPIGYSSLHNSLLQLDDSVSRALGMCATQHWKGENPLEKANSNHIVEPILGQFLVKFCNQVLP